MNRRRSRNRAFLTRNAIVAFAGDAAQRFSGMPRYTMRGRALHEAAHAVMVRMLGGYICEATIIADPLTLVGRGGTGSSGGHVMWALEPPAADWRDRAPKRRPDRPNRVENDIARGVFQAHVLALTDGTDWRTVLSVARELRRAARNLVAQHWPRIEALADALEAGQTVDGPEAERIIEAAA